MIWLVVVLVVVGLPLVALLFGADSRDGRDWQPLRGLPNSSLDTDWSSPHMAGADGTNKVVSQRERVKQG